MRPSTIEYFEMQAIQLTYDGYNDYKVTLNDIESPISEMSKNDLLIIVKAVAIQPLDQFLVQELLRKKKPLAAPITLGYNVSGIVAVTGELVTDFKVGDSIFACVPQHQMGTLSEYTLIDANSVCLKPTNLSFEEAATLPLVSLTSIEALRSIEIEKSQKILIYSDGCNLCKSLIQYAKAEGAYVYACADKMNLKKLDGSGADEILEYKSLECQRILKNVDIILDTRSAKEKNKGLDCTKTQAQIIDISPNLHSSKFSQEKNKDSDIPMQLIIRNREKRSCKKIIKPSASGSDLQKTKKMAESGLIRPPEIKIISITKSIDLLTEGLSDPSKPIPVVKIN